MNDGSDDGRDYISSLVYGQQNTNTWHTLKTSYSTDGVQVHISLPPPTKLREGEVFSRVCLSVILFTGVPHVTTADLFKLIPFGPKPWP